MNVPAGIRPLISITCRRNVELSLRRTAERVRVRKESRQVGTARPSASSKGTPGVARRSKRADPGQLATDRELVDGLRTFIGNDAFQVERVPDRHVLRTDP